MVADRIGIRTHASLFHELTVTLNHVGYEIVDFFHGLDALDHARKVAGDGVDIKRVDARFVRFSPQQRVEGQNQVLAVAECVLRAGDKAQVPESLHEGEGTGAVAVRDGVEQLILDMVALFKKVHA